MDNFLQIDWNPSLEDIVDDKFIDGERFRKESVMYRMLKGNFTDPFADLHEEQDHLVTSDLMAQIGLEKSEDQKNDKPNKTAAACVKPKEEVAVQKNPKKNAYVPGLSKGRVWFPRQSSLSREQQALCLRVLLKFYGSQRPKMTASDNEELQIYSSLSQTIAQEQQEFMDFAKERWDASKFEIHDEEFVNEQWKKKTKRVDRLPRYYTETGNVPFVSPKEVGLTYHFCCLKMGTLPNSILPTLTRRSLLTSETPKINQRFFSSETNAGNNANVLFKTTVSEDGNCEKLAKHHGADLVVSSGGLNCLTINMDPQNTHSWILPAVVKRINEKNVVFIDKPLPPTGLTVMQKNAWLFKYKLKLFVNHPYHMKAISLDKESPIDASIGLENSVIADDETGDDDGDKNGENENSAANENPNDGFFRPPAGHNLFYRLFSVGPSGEAQNELLKNRVEKSYKLLVRTKTDGSISLPEGARQMMLVAPRLEHQMDLGAEAVTMEEAAKQWMSLIFRPETSLARVRIDATTSEMIQIETRNPISVNNEIKRLYKLKTETALTLIHNVAETMTGMMPGRYLIRHTVRSGAFANIYKEADGPGKNAFDLQTIYWGDEFPTLPNPPWPAIDKGVITPAMKLFERMPAMFNGVRKINSVKNIKRETKKKTSKAKVVRKSPRKKPSE